ncbi:hypothetical protein RND81_13G174000 [Saponaria officinalis]|uniref:Ribosomal protein S4 n=1 Tax=Saponaria officinalis TaxID=3572 RepID=A0AAW1H4B1_SAPOF
MTTHNPTHLAPIFRPDPGTRYQPNGYLERRQLFLRSYQFSRKRSLGEKLKRSLVRVKRLFSVRFRSARKLRRVVWSDLRYALYVKRRRLSRLVNYYYYNVNSSNKCSNNFKFEFFHRSFQVMQLI